MRLLKYFVFLLLLNSCSGETSISVDIEVDRMTINNKIIDKTNFEEKLKITIDSLVNSGVNKSKIDVHVTADRRISEYEMSKVEKAIRRQGVTREYAWTD